MQIIEEMTRLEVIRAYAIGGGIAATYYIEPVLTYDLDIFFRYGLVDRLEKLEDGADEK